MSNLRNALCVILGLALVSSALAGCGTSAGGTDTASFNVADRLCPLATLKKERAAPYFFRPLSMPYKTD